MLIVLEAIIYSIILSEKYRPKTFIIKTFSNLKNLNLQIWYYFCHIIIRQNPLRKKKKNKKKSFKGKSKNIMESKKTKLQLMALILLKLY